MDDSTAEHRTSALRELNSNYPSRHRYAKSTGAKSSTYSEPVIVRSYYNPTSSRPVSSTRGTGIVLHQPPSTPASENRGPTTVVRQALPFTTTVTSTRHGKPRTMTRARSKSLMGGNGGAENALLPPMEAFTFKSFMANMESQSGPSDINADLDRIAEICARSRYSLSNQYEVHYAPHGSGSSFLGTSSRSNENQGPTLQIVTSDDEQNIRRQRKRRVGARRNSRAMGTLETIMSSSRSSDEDKTKKKSAAEIAEEVRGRAAKKEPGPASPGGSSRSTSDEHSSLDEQLSAELPAASRKSSLALIEGSKQNTSPYDPASPRTSATGLVGPPALPQTSTSQLEIRTAPEEPLDAPQPSTFTSRREPPPADVLDPHMAKGSISTKEDHTLGTGLFSTLSAWIPWTSSGGAGAGRAEGSLRELLKTTDMKGKSAERL